MTGKFRLTRASNIPEASRSKLTPEQLQAKLNGLSMPTVDLNPTEEPSQLQKGKYTLTMEATEKQVDFLKSAMYRLKIKFNIKEEV